MKYKSKADPSKTCEAETLVSPLLDRRGFRACYHLAMDDGGDEYTVPRDMFEACWEPVTEEKSVEEELIEMSERQPRRAELGRAVSRALSEIGRLRGEIVELGKRLSDVEVERDALKQAASFGALAAEPSASSGAEDRGMEKKCGGLEEDRDGLRKANKEWEERYKSLQECLKEMGSDGGIYKSTFEEAIALLRHWRKEVDRLLGAVRDAENRQSELIVERDKLRTKLERVRALVLGLSQE